MTVDHRHTRARRCGQPPPVTVMKANHEGSVHPREDGARQRRDLPAVRGSPRTGVAGIASARLTLGKGHATVVELAS